MRTGENGHAVAAEDGDPRDTAWRVEEASLVLVELTLDAVVEHGDLSVTQLRTLLAVERHGPLNLSALAAHLGGSVSAAGRVVSRLDGAGLLTRALSPRSRREVSIEVTPLGLLSLERLRAGRRRHIAEVLSRLPAASAEALARTLAEFTAAARATDPPAPSPGAGEAG
ncbi:hypothetical protein Sru01_53250 [Sphaerisporangium rufum]|uniref:HTH marR-type domain-containing protein n=1 Tax=Sphaerisporangium rufum TaxID=1381558 RepID=A0A919R6V2_9ACTN|nr:MarR family transcriptional regulator [Sphaerisporangium rufum]GII80343.1 hypothetical protein Sru01_53250 [Sphaerisporangium rufum]